MMNDEKNGRSTLLIIHHSSIITSFSLHQPHGPRSMLAGPGHFHCRQRSDCCVTELGHELSFVAADEDNLIELRVIRPTVVKKIVGGWARADAFAPDVRLAGHVE